MAYKKNKKNKNASKGHGPKTAKRKKATRGDPRKADISLSIKRDSHASFESGVLEQKPLFSGDIESMLIQWLSARSSPSPSSRLLLPDLLFSSAESLSEFGYSYGFQIGRKTSMVFKGNNINALVNLLEASGLGRVLYLPSTDRVIIRSAKLKKSDYNTGLNMHTYEAGLISGYLSYNTSKEIYTYETSCIYNGSDRCQFISEALEEKRAKKQQIPSKRNIRFLLEYINHSEIHKITGGDAEYTLLGVLPFISENTIESSSKLMFSAGRELASSEKEYHEIIEMLASLFCISGVKTRKRGKKTEIILNYGTGISAASFIEFSTKTFIGFISKRFNSLIALNKRRTKEGYEATISFEGA